MAQKIIHGNTMRAVMRVKDSRRGFISGLVGIVSAPTVVQARVPKMLPDVFADWKRISALFIEASKGDSDDS